MGTEHNIMLHNIIIGTGTYTKSSFENLMDDPNIRVFS